MKNKFSIVIPVYNEEKTIGSIINRIKKIKGTYEIIVIDDGSNDNTIKEAKKAGAAVYSHTYNLGNGAAIKTGIQKAKFPIVVLMDGDGQHQPEDIPKLLDYIGPYDMVIGARTKKSKVSQFRGIGNFILIMIAEYLSGHKILDLTSGFRACKKNYLLKFIHLLPNRFSYPTTLTLAFAKSGYFIYYYPLDSIMKRSVGKSKIKPFRDGFKFIRTILRIIMIFEPQKIFTPIGMIIFFIGICVGISQVIFKGTFYGGAVIFILGGIFIFLFSLLAEQIAEIRRNIKF